MGENKENKQFKSVDQAVEYLAKVGWKVSAKSMYRHIQQGWINAKPWDKEELIKVVKILLTKFIVENGIEYKDKTDITDAETLFELLRK